MTEEEYRQAKAAALASAQGSSISLPGKDFWARPTVWATLLHLSVLAGYVIPLAGFIAPLVLWQARKEDPFIDAHGRIVANAIFSFLIWSAVSFVLMFFLVGFAMLWGLCILVIALPLVGAIKAYQGKVWAYPLTISFFRIEAVPGSN